MNSLARILKLPGNWLLNLINIQEKKEYNFYVILVFALFVGIVRFLLEFMLSDRPLFGFNMMLAQIFSFYLLCIFIYTAILKLFVKDLIWKRSIHLVLIGVFLGILPPVIDSLIYGPRNFTYGYVPNFISDWRILFVNKDASLPFGEAFILICTIFFTALVIYIKEKSIVKLFLALIVTYAAIFFYASFLPHLADQVADFSYQLSNKIYLPNIGIREKTIFFTGFPSAFTIAIFQIVACIILYFYLNPSLFLGIFKRLNHAFPVVLTCLLSYSLIMPIDFYAYIIGGVMLLLSVTVIVQNDYFDNEEDAITGRPQYVNKDDVMFFNSIALFLIFIFAAVGNFVAVPMLLFFLVSVIYNHDFYRGKSYFPANYKIEGMWGFSAATCGIVMAMVSKSLIAGNILQIISIGILYPDSKDFTVNQFYSIWSLSTLLIVFFVFGGWSIISVIKDYKDIEGDARVGNQTAYTLLLKKGKDIAIFHKKYSQFLFMMMMLPIIWLLTRATSFIHIIVLIALTVMFYFSITKQASTKTVERSLLIVNLYLLNLVFAGHFSH